MNNNDIERYTQEVIEDLKKKIEDITVNASSQDEQIIDRLNEVKDKAVKILNNAIKAIDNGIKSIADSEELEKGLSTAKERSLQLYEETIKKLNEIKDSEALKKGFEEIKQSSIQVKENIDEFMNSEEVKQTIEKAKTGTIDVAEKALDTLKSWLSPEGEDK